MRKWILAAFALSAVLLLAINLPLKSQSRSTPTHAPQPKHHPQESGEAFRLTGTIVALKSATLTAPRIRGSRSGLNRGGDTGAIRGGGDFNLVLLSLAKPGSHVKAGQIVAQFDAQSQQDRLDDYKDTVVQLEDTVKTMRANLGAVMEAQAQNVRTAKATWEQAIEDLKAAPALSDIDIEKRKLSVQEAEASYQETVKQTKLLEESQQSQIRVSELNLAQARIELQQAESNVERMTIRAPIDGIAVMANIVRNGEYAQIREGDQINAGQPFLSIVDPGDMALTAVANQVDAERLELGIKTTVRLDAYPQVQLPGTVVGVGALAKPSALRASYVAEIPIRIHIEKPDDHLIPDLTGSAEFDVLPESGQ